MYLIDISEFAQAGKKLMQLKLKINKSTTVKNFFITDSNKKLKKCSNKAILSHFKN